MVKLPDSPGPGEGGFSPQQAEGAMDAPNGDALVAAYHSHLVPQAGLADWSDGADPAQDPTSVLRRTSSELESLLRVRPEGVSNEPRLDHSLRDLQRENALDSKQDDAGPLSDKN